MELLFINKVPGNKSEFGDKVKHISSPIRLDINPNWLMFLMDFESAGTFSASVTNPYGCVGLIQFCPDFSGGTYKVINGMRYNMSDIRDMSNVRQLDLVYEYLKERKGMGKFATYHDLYFAILYPKAMGKPDNYQITTSSNPIFDIDKSGTITVGEVKRFLDDRVSKTVPIKYQDEFKKKLLFCEDIGERLSLVSF